MDIVEEKCSGNSYKKLEAIKNPKLHTFIKKYIDICNPDSVFVRTDSPEDAEYVRKKAIENGEELNLATDGHTIHSDGYYDQARDKANTKYLLRPDEVLGSDIRSCDRRKGLDDKSH